MSLCLVRVRVVFSDKCKKSSVGVVSQNTLQTLVLGRKKKSKKNKQNLRHAAAMLSELAQIIIEVITVVSFHFWYMRASILFLVLFAVYANSGHLIS